MIALAFDLGGHHLRGAAIDEAGKILDREGVETASDRDPGAVVDQIASVARVLEGRSGPFVGAGLGIPGFMNVDTGFVFSSPNFPSWTNFRLGDALKTALRLPVALENDANCATLGEWWLGAAKNTRYAVGLTLGTGVGGGIVIDGALVRGFHGTGGELGHMSIDPAGPVCGCGGRGCLEAFVGGDHVMKRTGRSVADWADAASKNDPKAVELFETMGTHLGIACSSLCQLFDPEVLVFGGQISRAFPLFSGKLRAELNSRLSRHPAKSMRLAAAELGDDAGLAGAALTAFRRADPAFGHKR